MLTFKRTMIVALAALGLLPAASSMAAVSLAITDNDGTPTLTSVVAGNAVNVSVKLLSTTTTPADSVIAVSYQLSATGPANSGVFTLVSRDTVGTPANGFTDYTKTNSSVLSPNLLAALSPINANGNANLGDLGALLNDISAPISNTDPNGTAIGAAFNPALVANYGISVAANAPAGVYTLSIVPIGFTNYNTINQTIGDGTFSNTPAASPIQQSFQITVLPIPEPSTALLLGLGLSALGMGRRRR